MLQKNLKVFKKSYTIVSVSIRISTRQRTSTCCPQRAHSQVRFAHYLSHRPNVAPCDLERASCPTGTQKFALIDWMIGDEACWAGTATRLVKPDTRRKKRAPGTTSIFSESRSIRERREKKRGPPEIRHEGIVRRGYSHYTLPRSLSHPSLACRHTQNYLCLQTLLSRMEYFPCRSVGRTIATPLSASAS
jgi:hypothetical protein